MSETRLAARVGLAQLPTVLLRDSLAPLSPAGAPKEAAMADAVPAKALQLRALTGALAPPDLVSALVAVGRSVRARKGQVLVEHGTEASDVYLVVGGRVRVELLAVEGREISIRDLVAGQFIGDLAAIDNGRRSASATALEPTELLIVPAAAFRTAVAASPESAIWFFGHLTALVRSLTDRVFEMSALNVQSRIHCQLVRMAAAAGVTDNCAVIDPMPTHEDLASLVGTHREAVTRELSWLNRAGLIVQQRRRLEIPRFLELSLLAQKARGSEM